MSPLMTRFLMLFTIAAAAVSMQAKASAAGLDELDWTKIQTVIAQQFSAFAEDDAERAFQTATPAVREAIGSSTRFLALVRGAYPMVYRPVEVSFHKPKEDDGTVLQLVEIKDGDDKSWLALFQLEQQPDATWRIAGCVVAENTWKAI